MPYGLLGCWKKLGLDPLLPGLANFLFLITFLSATLCSLSYAFFLSSLPKANSSNLVLSRNFPVILLPATYLYQFLPLINLLQTFFNGLPGFVQCWLHHFPLADLINNFFEGLVDSLIVVMLLLLALLPGAVAPLLLHLVDDYLYCFILAAPHLLLEQVQLKRLVFEEWALRFPTTSALSFLCLLLLRKWFLPLLLLAITSGAKRPTKWIKINH